ncbi:MAG: lytic transglycosylase F [Pseudomonadota bacterium]
MKQLFGFYFAALIVCSTNFAAPAASAQSDSASSNAESLDLAALAQRFTGDLDALAEKRVVRVLTVYGPGRFHLDDGQGKGFVAELAQRFEKHINKELGKGHIKVYVIVVPVARNELLPALLEGRGDIIAAGWTITPQRMENVDFSIPMSKPLNEILVTGPSAQTLEDIKDLSGKTVYLRESSSYRESIESLNESFQGEGLSPIKIKSMPGTLEDDDLIEMVNGGLLPWAIVDNYKPQMWEGVFNQLKLRTDIVFRRGGQTAWALRKNSPLLRASVDRFIKENRAGTLIGNILIKRYVKNFDWAENSLADEDYRLFNDLQHLFERYGALYEVDSLFAAAQGYQESRLDQSVRSAAGAVGVMQLLPATAADKNVGIDNIDEVEPNIHAGIKYMDFLRDRYYSDPNISNVNRFLLSLAAYNAGPGRMIGMRRRAEAAGYDPNVWFDNVELIAAKEIGRETVQYVSNIYRYYLTYLMVANKELEHAAARRAAGLGTTVATE